VQVADSVLVVSADRNRTGVLNAPPAAYLTCGNARALRLAHPEARPASPSTATSAIGEPAGITLAHPDCLAPMAEVIAAFH
jgi:hypothetical protein